MEDPDIAEAAGVMGTPCVQIFKVRRCRLNPG